MIVYKFHFWYEANLTHFSPVSHFYTPWKCQKTKGWKPNCLDEINYFHKNFSLRYNGFSIRLLRIVFFFIRQTSQLTYSTNWVCFTILWVGTYRANQCFSALMINFEHTFVSIVGKISQLAITCSKLRLKTLEQGVKYVQSWQ